MSNAVAYHKNGIGNLILSTPALQALATLSDNGKIDVCIPEWEDSRKKPCIDLLNEWDIVENVIDKPEKEYDLWFYTDHCEFGPVYDIFRNKSKQPFFNPAWKESALHESVHYMKYINRLGYRGRMPKQVAPVKKFDFPEKKEGEFFVGLCDGAFGTAMWDKKHWPHFKKLSYMLSHWFDCKIIKVGAGEELKDVPADYDFVNKLTLPETSYAISKLDLFITTDTGNMHIGDAHNIPMIALFGATLLSKNKPISPKSLVLTADMGCQPCQCGSMFNTCKDYHCMKHLTVGDVMNAARKVLA